jgi:O-antigen ligase
MSQIYYDYVGKQNNNEFRYFLLKNTIAKIKENFWLGSLYRSEPTATIVSGNNIVTHNDYINILYGGGIVALFLFLAVSIWIVNIGIGYLALQGLSNSRGKVVYAITSSFVGSLILSNFSALLSKPNNSVVFYTLGLTIVVLSKSGAIKENHS